MAEVPITTNAAIWNEPWMAMWKITMDRSGRKDDMPFMDFFIRVSLGAETKMNT